MEVFQNGNFSNGDPVYQIGTKKADGSYDITVYDLMSKAEAELRLESMVGIKKAVKKPTKEETPDYSNMTKVELEALMREFGVELDRRQTKKSLLSQVTTFFKNRD